MKSNQVVSVTWTSDWSALTFTAIGAGAVTLSLNDIGVGNDLRDLIVDAGKSRNDTAIRALFHGLTQKVRDAAAQNQREATPATRLAAMRTVVDTLKAGRWAAERKGGERIGADELTLTQALAELYATMDPDKVRAKVASMRPEERRAWLAGKVNPAILPIVERLRTAQAAAVDTGKLLADFES